VSRARQARDLGVPITPAAEVFTGQKQDREGSSKDDSGLFRRSVRITEPATGASVRRRRAPNDGDDDDDGDDPAGPGDGSRATDVDGKRVGGHDVAQVASLDDYDMTAMLLGQMRVHHLKCFGLMKRNSFRQRSVEKEVLYFADVFDSLREDDVDGAMEKIARRIVGMVKSDADRDYTYMDMLNTAISTFDCISRDVELQLARAVGQYKSIQKRASGKITESRSGSGGAGAASSSRRGRTYHRDSRAVQYGEYMSGRSSRSVSPAARSPSRSGRGGARGGGRGGRARGYGGRGRGGSRGGSGARGHSSNDV
jgi:hypothetical protein